mgnify:CR=1 FL=1
MSSLHQPVLAWYKKNKRDLPWRNTDAWGVLVSEIMLQQTPVARVLPIYIEWMKRWPTPAALAAATPAQIITAWGRLGYPRRALRLHECAKVISEKYKGRIPDTQSELRELPGIGDYTSAAIIAFAFEGRSLVLDINIRRVFARVIDGVEVPTAAPTKSERQEREKLIPSKNPHVWAAATMELGALICTATKPKCEICPLVNSCLWRANGFPPSQTRKKKVQKWHGTDRQCRGVVIEHLRHNKKANQSKLAKLWKDQSQLEKCLQALVKDGLIAQTNKDFSLVD